jgi:AraC-like DNA-binding protein
MEIAEGTGPPAGRQDFETTDVMEAQEYLSQAYGTRIRLSGDRGGQVLRHSRADARSFRVDDVQLPLDLRFAAGPLDMLAVVELHGGTMEWNCGGVTGRPVAGDVFIGSQPGRPSTATTHEVRARTTVLTPAELDRVASTGPPHHGPVRFTGFQPVSEAAARHWTDISGYVSAGLLANPEARAQPLLVSGASRLLAATALMTFPNTAVFDPTAQDRRDATTVTVRRAAEFIQGNAQRDISLADIAAAAHVTARAVQLAFRRQLGITPTQYLRRVRLDLAHQDLLNADPALTTITAVSARWGFASSSRFAAYYRQVYGVPPSETLRG